MVDNKLVSVSLAPSLLDDDALKAQISALKAERARLLDLKETYTRYIIHQKDLVSRLSQTNDELSQFDYEDPSLDDLHGTLAKLKKDQVDQALIMKDIARTKDLLSTKKYSDTISTLEKDVRHLHKALQAMQALPANPELNESTEEELRDAISSCVQQLFIAEAADKAIKDFTYELDDKRYQLLNNIFSSTVAFLESEIKPVHIVPVCTFSEDDTRASITTIQNLLLKKQDFRARILSLNTEIGAIESRINELTLILASYGDIDNNILTAETNIIKYKTEYASQSLLVSKMCTWEAYAIEFKKWKQMKDRLDKEKVEEATLRKKTEALLLLRDKVLETQSISISNLIDNINTHAQIFLDKFFTDNPISVKIVAFKEGKTGDKPCVNLEIDYRGIDHDMSMLSGGEMSRVTLAFTLALAEIHNSPLIMLDESTASLDQECVIDVIEGIHETFRDKLVLLIAHQVVKGVFDKTIEL